MRYDFTSIVAAKFSLLEHAARYAQRLSSAQQVKTHTPHTSYKAGHRQAHRHGQGEHFWQYRPYMVGDAVKTIDWRTSARTTTPLVREQEQQIARTTTFTIDPRPTMAYYTEQTLSSHKMYHACLISMILCGYILQKGDMISINGARPQAYPHTGIAFDTLIRSLNSPVQTKQEHTNPGNQHIIISDGLGSLDTISTLLPPPTASLLFIHLHEPAERDFPFDGRVRFHDVTPPSSSYIIGNCAITRPDYKAAYTHHCQALKTLVHHRGGTWLSWATDDKPDEQLNTLIQSGWLS